MNAPFLEMIDAGRRFVLAGHERPDGDCVGAQVAMYHLLTALGKEVAICNPDPLPANLDVLARGAPIGHFDRQLPQLDVLILLDCAHLSRLGRRMADAVAARAPRIAVVDHHVGSEQGDGEACYVDSGAPATGALVLRLFRHYGLPVPRPAAEAVFVSVVSDTGWFRYSNTDAEVFAVAHELVGAGVEPAALYDALYRRNHPESVDFLARALASWQLELGGRFAHVGVGRDEMERAGRIGFDLDSVMEPLRSVGGVEVVAMLKENVRGVVKISLRAVGEVDVQAIAARFGGGGHKKAAGASFDGTLDEALRALRPVVVDAIEAGGGVGR